MSETAFRDRLAEALAEVLLSPRTKASRPDEAISLNVAFSWPTDTDGQVGYGVVTVTPVLLDQRPEMLLVGAEMESAGLARDVEDSNEVNGPSDPATVRYVASWIVPTYNPDGLFGINIDLP